ncbi:McrC family protein [Priestia aryabhattai]|uniref:McrC family protein n=1 Tax=Priestia aryabhattai TaxID=412384 RepID=UPI003D7F61A3
MKHFVLTESYDELMISEKPLTNAIHPTQAAELEAFIKKNNLHQKNFLWGRNKLTIINYVGYIRLSNFSMEVLPKVSISKDKGNARKVLINMLKRSGNIKTSAFSSSDSLNMINDNLFEIFAHVFISLLLKELHKGMFFDYTPHEENSSVLKGSLVISEHVKNITYKKSEIYCRYDQYSVNNKLNQVFKAAIEFLIGNIKNLNTIKKLKFCMMWFSEVDHYTFTAQELEHFKFDRLNNRFEPSYILAKMLLANRASDFTQGKKSAFSLLFRMNELFESYISSIIKTCISNVVLLQHMKHKLLVKEGSNKHVYGLKPDILIINNSKDIIIDTKWKKINSNYNHHGVKREDFFQMYAYLTRYKNVKSVLLFYPYNENIKLSAGEMLESWHLEEDIKKRIKVYSVDLTTEYKTQESIYKILMENLN